MSSRTNIAWGNIRYAIAVAAVAVMVSSQLAVAAEGVEFPDTLFTAKSFVSTEVATEFGFDNLSAGNEFEIGFDASKVFFDRLGIGVDVPIGINDPDVGKTVANLGDVGFSAQYQLAQAATDGFNFSLAGTVSAPTGSRKKDIGGTGDWGVFALAGVAVPLGEGMPQLFVQTQLGYEQQIRLSNEQLETAETLGVGNIRDKAVIWRLAFSLPLLNGRLIPTFEILGRTAVDAVASADEGTTLELGGGIWWNRVFAETSWEPVSIGVAAKGPITKRREADFSTLLVVKYEFD